jgi:tryptophanyl-tRNA synthetase
LCGLRPTGQLHIGHYFSVIKPAHAGAEVLIANYHAPEEKSLEEIVAVLRKFGVERIKIQRDIFNPELYFQLLTIASIGDLERMTQYKATREDQKTAQLLTYPVLMTHDVAGYEEVLVGEDQRQHLEYARRLLRRYNRKFGKDYMIPRENVSGGKIKDLRSPEQKMSKSSPEGCLFLSDDRKTIAHKIKRATMDQAGRDNLVLLYSEFVGGEIPESNSVLKDRLTEALCATLRLA